MPTYSFGKDSPIKFEISDAFADLYNQASEEFFKAHRRFTQKFGRPWDPADDPIQIKWTNKQRKAWNTLATMIADAYVKDGPFHENDFMDDFLVKNVGEALMRKKKFGWGLSLAVTTGMLYELLRRR